MARLEQVLSARTPHRFVGRRSELELFRHAQRAPAPPFAVLYVYGPAGIGKSTLLKMFAELAREEGRTILEVDGRDLDATPAAVQDAFGPVLADPAGREPSGVLVLVDTFERLAPLESWIRTAVLPRMPATALVVLAGRKPPSAAWRADPPWDGMLRTMPLRNLAPDEVAEYLTRRGISPSRRDEVLAITHGHPLGLSLLADLVAQSGGEIPVDPLTPDLVGSLLRWFVDAVPSSLHRRALEVCALTRATTEPLLRDALDLADAHELFAWLRELSFVEAGPDGVFPHDLARDALIADLRWRDPESYQQLFRGITSHLMNRLKTTKGRERLRLLFDAKFLHRYQPVSRVMYDWETLGHNYPEAARPEDREPLLELIRRWEGPESAAIAERWWARQPDGFFAVRDHDGRLRGVVASVELTRASSEDIRADPAASAAHSYVERHGPTRPGEIVTQWRFVVDRDAYQGPSPTVNCAPILAIQQWLATPKLAWSFIALADADRWDDFFAFFDIHRARGADFEISSRRYGLFGHDFRRVPVEPWLSLMFERDLSGTLDVPAAPPEALLVLSKPEFEEAVRRALRDLHRPDRLAANPLVQSRLVRARGGSDDAACLAAIVRDAAARLERDPRGEKFFHAVDRTFLRPAPTQERAAEVLGLPFSTYRRHLGRGVDRIVADLWDQELRAAVEAEQ